MPCGQRVLPPTVFLAQVALALACASVVSVVVDAQPPADAGQSWTFSAEAGAVHGGTWLDGKTVPRVRGGFGAAFSVATLHHPALRTSVGLAARLAIQPVRVREADVSWDGGTLTDAQLMGVAAWSLRTQGTLRPQAEFGAGVSLLSGARAVYPLTGTQVAPTVEAGLSVSHDASGASVRRRTLALFVRYAITRLDPGVAPLGDTNAALAGMSTASGWAGRTSVGIRMGQ